MATGKLPYSESLPYAGTLTATKPVTKQSIVNTVPTSQAATTVDYMQPIPRLFDVDKYLDGMAAAGKQTKKEKKYLSALGYALQLGNPNFDPTAYLRNYEQEQAALNEAELNRLTAADRMRVSREVLRRSKALDIETPEQFGEALTNWGVLGLDLRKNLMEDFKQFQPDRKLALDEIRDIRAMRNTARDDVAGLVKDPIKRIKTIEDAATKVKITARTPTAADRQWVLDNYNIGEISSNDPDKESKGIRDIALINSYQRMIDDATVREGDVALQQASASLYERAEIAFERIMGGTFLNDDQRREMQRLADEFQWHVIRNNIDSIKDARNILTSRYRGSTGSKDLKEADIDSDFYSKVSKSDLQRWEREFRKGQSRMKQSSQERPIIIYEEHEKESYLPGTLLKLNGKIYKVK